MLALSISIFVLIVVLEGVYCYYKYDYLWESKLHGILNSVLAGLVSGILTIFYYLLGLSIVLMVIVKKLLPVILICVPIIFIFLLED